jgi:hypothetical protein
MFGARKYLGAMLGLAALCTTLLTFPVTAGPALATISGRVSDADGAPIVGARVRTKGSPIATTDAGGRYTLTNVKQKKRVIVDFSKDGYVDSQRIVALRTKVAGEPNDVDTDDGTLASDKRALSSATVSNVMSPVALAATVVNAAGGSLVAMGSKVTFTPESIKATGNVTVAVTPVDLKSTRGFGGPASLEARDNAGKVLALSLSSVIDVTISQNGKVVNLRPGNTATVELILPSNSSWTVGQVVPMWYYDASAGIWKREGNGVVSASTTTVNRFAVVATVTHFTWWAAGYSEETTAVTGRVVNQNGEPLSAVEVVGSTYGGVNSEESVNYSSTDGDGYYCIQLPVSKISQIRAYHFFGSLIVGGSLSNVSAGGVPLECPQSSAPLLPNLVIDVQTSCVTGAVIAPDGQPDRAVSVWSSAGGFTYSDSNGGYTLDVPSGRSVLVSASFGLRRYSAATVIPNAPGGPCVRADIQRIASPSAGSSCLVGTYINPFAPATFYQRYPNGYVDTSIALGQVFQGPSETSYCVDNLPQNIFVSVLGSPAPESTAFTGSGSQAGSCANRSSCLRGPDVSP